MEIKLPSLPYELSALEPHISSRTLEFHHGKHHQTYVTNVNNLIKNTDFALKSLDEIIQLTATASEHIAIFNNAAQVWNHTFYWHCMTPQGGGKPQGLLLEMINKDFGSFEAFCASFKNAATSQFGSGWAWLVLENNILKVMKTGNADCPQVHNYTPLLTCDVWEHAYYLDYQNRRADYIDIFLTHLVNWNFALDNLTKALGK